VKRALLLVLAMSGCSGARSSAEPALREGPVTAPPSAVVRAKCGGCHRLPVPVAGRDATSLIEEHSRRVPLTEAQTEDVRRFLEAR
jgi:hypothetical protein